ncbi:MAG: hypothetical protein IMZ64_08755, partial [Bacteroidetes bacterium]|nr:hypothetical protein [Bacteroidota bacterium]
MSNKNSFYWMFLFVLGLSACNREVYIPPYHTPTLPPAKLSIIRDGTVENDSLSSEPAAVVTEMFDTSVYTEQNPATDPSEINALLEIIKQRYLSGITKEGWCASTDEYHTGQMWVYISDP